MSCAPGGTVPGGGGPASACRRVCEVMLLTRCLADGCPLVFSWEGGVGCEEEGNGSIKNGDGDNITVPFGSSFGGEAVLVGSFFSFV